MALLKIYKVEDIHEQHPLIELGEGEHKIGRDNLQCKDKRISRNHAILNVSPQNSTFKLVKTTTYTQKVECCIAFFLGSCKSLLYLIL